MSLILVIEQDGSYTERIQGALAAEGWNVQVVGDRAAAMRAAAAEAPDLVLVSTAAPGAAEMLRSFGRAQGGPGAMALTAAGQAPPAADGSLAKPFTDEQLRVSVRRCLSRGQRAAAEAAAAKAALAGAQLTSQDLFGDLLAEVEEEAARPKPKPAARPATADIDKQLQQTLSGMLDSTRTKPAAKPAGARPPTAPTATLTAAAAAATAAASTAAPATPARPVAPAPPPPAAPPVAPPVAAAPPAAAAPAPPAKPAPAPPPPQAAAPPAPSAAQPKPASAPPAPASPAAPAAAAAARPAARPRTGEHSPGDVEDLLSQTLSGLGVGPRPKRAASGPVPAAAAAAVAAAAAPSPAAPAPPRVEPPAATPPAPREEPSTAKAPPPVEPPPSAPERREPPAPARERGRDKGKAKATPPPQPVVSTVAPTAPAGGFATVRVETPKAPEQFGAYTLLDRVALGGMAEVWKARMEGVEGFRKTVAIKKILPHLTDSVDFVTMFIDEAKLAAQLNHPNIIHIYDLGKLGEDYYIAMEYVEGKDLRSILNTARKREQALPAGLALLVAARLASALDYAHRKRDFDNRELGLVHRDVSPQNVLISYEGDIKLCDFGIVKAVAKASKTQMGALKGKLQYMSPEQAWGRVVDARSDIFSLGAVLFEMLTGRRLFAGESEISVLEAVREARIQSVRSIDPGISEPVDAIVHRALAKDPDDRYQTAGEMQKEIEAVLHNFKPNPSQGELAAYMHRLFSEEAAQGVPAAPIVMPVVAAVPSAGAEVPAVAPVGGLQEGEEGARKKPWLLPVAAAFVLVVGGLVWWLTRGGGTSAPASAAPAEAPAAAAAAPAAAPGTTVVPAAVPAAVPGGTAAMQRRMQDELRAKEAAFAAQLADQRKKMEAELNKPQAQPSAAASAKPAPTQVAANTPPPAPAPTRVEEPPPPAPTVAAAPAPPPEPEPAAPAAAAPEPARVSEGDFVAPGTPGLAPPAFVSVSKPEYPALAKRLGVQGVVVVSVLVNEQGVVEQTRIVRGIAQKVGINEEAVKAAKSARYRPATLNGVRVKTWANLSIPFKM
ncbi:MAG TPA: TonB family protein [Thermoanaerobaculia bacterium]|jgi:TonB family protein|nr:TonB family protein [Thermoanaerobaculia bacterium]